MIRYFRLCGATCFMSLFMIGLLGLAPPVVYGGMGGAASDSRKDETEFWEWFSGSRAPNSWLRRNSSDDPLPAADTECSSRLAELIKDEYAEDRFIRSRIKAGDLGQTLGALFDLDSIDATWRLEAFTVNWLPNPSYCLVQNQECEQRFWIGRVPSSAYWFATTIRGRFISLGHPAMEGPWDATHIFDESGKTRVIGDSIFVLYNEISHVNPTDSSFVERFRSAIDSATGTTLSNRRTAELYLQSVYPFQALFIIGSPLQLDQLYRFAWSDPKTLSMSQSDSLMCLKLKKAGITAGDFMVKLPENSANRPGPLPSVLLEKFHGHWFQHVPSDSTGSQNPLSLTVLIGGDLLLAEVSFHFEEGTNRLLKVNFERMLNLSRQFD